MKVYIKTYGCSLNAADSETMMGLLKEAGHDIVENAEEADVIIVNTCIVKKPTELAVLKYLKDLPDKPVVVAGCMSQIDDFADYLGKYSLLGTDHLNEIAHVLEATFNGNRVVLVGREKNERLNLPKIRRNEIVEIIPISKGCLGECSYCIVRKARGGLVSYAKEAIVESVQRAVDGGVKEIWLTSQDCGAYGKDIDSSLPELLKAVLKVNGEFKIRLGMTNPNFVYEYLVELIEFFKNDKMFKFLHIPVQSGSDSVLKNMKRKYTVEDFRAVVNTFREEIPEMTIATDVIIGFPGESEEDFNESLLLIEELEFDVLNISRFFPRPGTEADRMEQLPGSVIKDRSRTMTDMFYSIVNDSDKEWLGWEGEVIIDEKSKEGCYVGRNYAYKPVIVCSDENLFGKIVKVKIKDIGMHDLRAELI